MVSELCIKQTYCPKGYVLILVLVEDGLRDNKKNKAMNNQELKVLILVLVEDGLRVWDRICINLHM